jgi:hypothetical protein
MEQFSAIQQIRDFLDKKDFASEVSINRVISSVSNFCWVVTLKERPPIGYQIFTKTSRNHMNKTSRTKFVARNDLSKRWTNKMNRLSIILAGTNAKAVFE